MDCGQYMKDVTNEFLSKNNIKFNSIQFHKKYITWCFNSFFKPFIYKQDKDMDTIYKIKNNVIFYNNNLFHPFRAGKEIFDNVPTMLKMQNKEMFELIEHVDALLTLQGNIEYPPRYFLKNFENSCGPDSILFILFFARRSYFINIVANNPGPSDLILFKEANAFKNEIREPLLDLYASGNYNTKIIDIQKIMTKYLDVSACYDFKSGAEIWKLITSAFSNLQFLVQTTHEKEIGNLPYLATYLDLNYDTNPDNIITDSDHLVYGDDLPPTTRDLRMAGFKMEHDKYILCGVLFFIDGCHYTSAIYAKNKWWYYDDFGSGKVKILKNAESGIFNERPSKKSQLLFYVHK